MMLKRVLIVILILFLAACDTPPDEATPLPATAVTATPGAAATDVPTVQLTATSTPVEEPTTTEMPMETATIAEVDVVPTESEEPTAIPATPIPTPNLEALTANGVSFQYDSKLMTGVLVETVPALEQRINAPGWNDYPTHDAFQFENYILSDSYPEAAVYVYPVLEMTSRSVWARQQVEMLQSVLAARPDLDADMDALPYLPITNASKVFDANPAYLSFGGGEGLRYLTMLSQSAEPITNLGLHYAFQGLTADGRYYIAALFPVRTDALSDEFDPNLDYEAFAANYEPYIEEIVATLNDLSTDEFTPDLTLLDDLAESITIEREPEPRRVDDNGNTPLTIVYPVNRGQLSLGEEVTIRGYTAVNTTTPISVSLTVGTNTLIAATAVPDAATGDWQATLVVPTNVTGQGQIVAVADTQVDRAVVYLDDWLGARGQSDVSVQMLRPIDGATAVSGYPVYFEGSVANPINNSITIGFLIDNCTTWASRQEFTVTGSASWTGVVILPANFEDKDACAVVYTGTYGEDWVETQRPLPIVLPTDEQAERLSLENGFTLEARAGEPFVLRGLAVEAPEVQVSLINFDTQAILVEGTAVVGDFGLWEIELLMPEDVPDLVGLQVVILDEPAIDSPYTLSTGITIIR